MNAQTTTLDGKSSAKLTDIVTLGLYSVGIGVGAVLGLVALLLTA
ncbi:MAG: hypothetical protein OQK24_10530 [Magnetovibrio sp.]|nr:hypothetical protein [Magnetovibrio sp.]